MNLKEFVTKKAKSDSPMGDLCGDILRVDKTGKYDWTKRDAEVLSAIELDVSSGSGGEPVRVAFRSFKKAYEKQVAVK